VQRENSPTGPQALLARIETLRSLPTLPHVLLRLIQACNRPEKGLQDLARLIRQDPALSERVLRLVNSPFFSLKQKVASIDQALRLVGVEAVKNIAISSSVYQVFHGAPAKHGLNLKGFWWHSLNCAVIARLLAVKTAFPSPEEAFLAGLLHDIGKILLWSSFRGEYSAILKSCGEGGPALLAAERRLGLTHAEAGAWLVGRWDLRSFLPDAVRYHHEPLERIAGSFPLVRIVFAANRLAGEGLAEAVQAVGLGAGDLESLRAEAEEEAGQIASSLEVDREGLTGAQPGPEDQVKDEALVRLVRDYSQLAGISESFLRASRQEEVLEALRRGLALLFDLASARYFRLENGELLSEPAGGGGELVIPYQQSSGLLARCLARGEVLDSFSPQAAPSIFDEQLARLLDGEGILCLPLRAAGETLGALAVGIRARDHEALASRETLLGLLADQASLALFALVAQERQAERIREERLGSASTQARRIVHEARNPLGIISNYLAILAAKLQDNSAIQEDLRIVREEIRRVSLIISELGNFTAPGPAARAPVDLNALLADLARISREPLWESSRIRMQLALDPKLPPLESEKNRLKQVFLNLIKNAAEAMPGGGDLVVQTRLLPGDPRRIEVSVRDEGGGIAEEVRPRLFEPFVSTKAQEGLGLSIASGIVQELGGSIRYETGSDGTTFRVELPAP
jgi:HD-like signal output (HDOD) protein/signal transduction histidine kinase